MGKIFINREDELNFLNNSYSSQKAELLVIYGRRRVGKTYLLTEGLGKDSIYLLAEESKTVLKDFSNILADEFDDRVLEENPLQSWKAFFTYITEKAKEEKLLVILDEVQYLAKNYKPFMSVLQKEWDAELKDTDITLVLCGSLMSFMEGVISGDSPIYGRRTGAWKLRPLRFLDLKDYHPIKTEESFKIYSIFGGVPQYWRDYQPKQSIWDNLDRMLFSKGGRYYHEPKYLLREEIREVSRYFSVLRAIANGYTSFGNIADASKTDTNSLGKYLNILEDMGYIKKEKTILGKGSRYMIDDNLFHFWFEFVYPRKHLIEKGEDVTGPVKKDFNRYLGRKYEDVAKEFLEALNRKQRLPFKFTKIGRWWHKGDEIDLVAVEEDKGMFFEVKWSELGDDGVKKIIDKLEDKTARFDLKEKYFGLITKDAPKRELVFTLDDISQI